MLIAKAANIAGTVHASVNRPKRVAKKYSLAEYLRKEDKAPERHEFHNGNIIPMAGGTLHHDLISQNASFELRKATENLEQRYLILGSNIKIYIPQHKRALYADALVVCDKPEFWEANPLLLTNPLLIVEVLSRSTKAFDRGDKFSYYRSLPSFQEYVLIDQDECRVESWFREEPTLWRETTLTSLDDTLPLRSLGILLTLRDIYANIPFQT